MSALPSAESQTQQPSPEVREGSPAPDTPRSPSTERRSAPRISDAPLDFRTFTRRLQTSSKAQDEAPPPAKPQPDATQSALSLLEEAANALPVLMEEILDLRNRLQDAQQKAADDLDHANGTIHDLQQTAESQAAEIESMERTIQDLRKKVLSLEESVARERSAAEEHSHKAAQAECLSTLFRERVTSSFGDGSPAQVAIQNARERLSQAGRT